MKTRAVILAGGTGARLGVLTSKRTKPAVPFAGKYRLIDFPLSNCVNSNLFDVIIIAQYRPHSLIEHIKAGGPWDLNRDLTGGIRIYTPYTATSTGWFKGTADAVRQNFNFIKNTNPDYILILSGDHVYSMNYEDLINFHIQNNADVTIGTLKVSIEEASRFGVIEIDSDQRVTSFIEKPSNPTSNLINIGVYLFNRDELESSLWVDHLHRDSSHDFGKNILPELVKSKARIFAYPYSGYWVDVGTVYSYWKAHMDMLQPEPAFDLYDQHWKIYTRTEGKPPAKIMPGAQIDSSMICEGCIIESGAKIIRSVLGPGVVIKKDATVIESIILTDTTIRTNSVVQHTIIDKAVSIGENSSIGEIIPDNIQISMVGKSSVLPPRTLIQAGGIVGPDVVPSDIPDRTVLSGYTIKTRRVSYEI